MPVLSVIVPVYNEAGTIAEVIRRVAASPVDKEILIVDDCSTDGTRGILQKLEQSAPKTQRFFYQERNNGKGAAIARAQREVSGDIAIIQDADLELDPNQYGSIIQPILDHRADVVYGSRFQSINPFQSLNLAANWLLTRLSNLLTGLHLTDMETCYKAIRADLFKSMNLRSPRFGIEVELTAYVAKSGARVVEVPITYTPRTEAKGKKINWKDGMAAIAHLIHFNLLTSSAKIFTQLPAHYSSNSH
jgi:glycosyltransferase involved in cell wall biosynthesis